MLNDILIARAIPPLRSREEMLEILQREEYGYMPPEPTRLAWGITENVTRNFCAGKAKLHKVELTSYFGEKHFTFPCYASLPTDGKKHPFFVMINFRPDIPDLYLPVEEIIDSGYAVLSFCYNDVTKDNGDFTDGLAGVLFENGERGDTDPGKIAMWAWAAHRVMDFACTLDCLDHSCACVCGHSRLGKTALLAAATDTRFAFAHSNDSGCSGAAITRDKEGERVKSICKNFPFWFCKNYYKYADRENHMPFDQHFLAAAIAPRYFYVASAEKDTWADPDSEMLTCAAASEAYERLGEVGFLCDDRLPKVGDTYHSGSIGYHLRSGTHYFSREDWKLLIDFIGKKTAK